MRLPIQNRNEETVFHTYGRAGPDPDIASATINAIEPIQRSVAQYPVGPGRMNGGVAVRFGLTRGDYEFFRPAEAIPRRQREIIAACDEAYWRNGLVHNIIDLMADFAAQGIQIFHPSKKKQERYRHWFRKIGGQERTERFLNLLYRHGNVVMKRAFADLNAGDLKDLEHGVAGRTPSEPTDMEYERHPKFYKNRIPLAYTFLNPTAVEVIGGDLGIFAGKPRYALRIPEAIIRLIKNPKKAEEKQIVAGLPDWVKGPVRAGKRVIPLDPEKISVWHYKKDDWQQWANPLTYPILSDIKLYEKNKLADMAALDGAISHIRLWRVGLPEHRIQPGPGAMKKLQEILLAAQMGGTLDLVWDATLDLQETSTDIYRFLGMQKYEPVLKAIYAGFGIPQTLTGGSKEQGMTNNALSLKTLIERLQYGREMAKEMWQRELHIVQEALGDSRPASVHFDNMTISDEANEKMLWINMYDRDIISLESLQEKFGHLPEVEFQRMRREYRLRDDGQLPYKIGPFADAAPHPDQMAGKALQVGLLSPSEAGIKKQPKKPGDKSLMDHQKDMQSEQLDVQKEKMKLEEKKTNVEIKQGGDLHQQQLQHNEDKHQQQLQHKETEHKAMLPIKKQAAKQKLQKGQPGQGRPKGQKDTQKRKRKVVNPRTAASQMSTQMWARGTQKVIADVVTPLYLERCNKKNMRLLTTTQSDELEDRKFRILFSLSPNSEVDKSAIAALWDEPPAAPEEAEQLMMSWVEQNYITRGVRPSVEDLREMQATAYAILHTADADGENDGEIDTES